MIARILSIWLRVKDSLWALPLAIAVACAALAILALNLDLPWTSDIGWLYAGTARQAPDFAASLVSALITLTALAFSITMVVLTLAAQQLGPRLIGIFMSDRATQGVLGLFIGTIVYLLVVLRSLDGAEDSSAPALAITVGTALALASVIMLLFFVHSLARSIVSDHVVARVGHALEHTIEANFPETPEPQISLAPEMHAPVRLDASGYVQYINYEGLAKGLKKCGASMKLAYSAGAHVLRGESDAWGRGTDVHHLERLLRSAVVISDERTAGQDPQWSIRQLVEIALRALSPGINDEFTALAVIDRLTLALSVLLRRHTRSGVWCDEDGAPRIYGPVPTMTMMLDSAFDQILESGGAKSAILHRLAENLCKLEGLCTDANRQVVASYMVKLKAALEDASIAEYAKTEIRELIAQHHVVRASAHAIAH